MRKGRFFVWIGLSASLSGSLAGAAVPSSNRLSEKLEDVKEKIFHLEQDLLGSVRGNREAKENMRRIQELISLQKREKEIGQERITEIESTIEALESRRSVIRERVALERRVIRKSLRDLQAISDHAPAALEELHQEEIDQPRSRMLAKLVQLSVREIETLKIDLEDAQSLEGRIQEERSQLEAMLHEMAESEEVLEMNRTLQVDLIRKTHQARTAQLENYRKLKASETQVSTLIQSFNARGELQEVQRQERAAQKQMYALSKSPFALLKGKLIPPIAGTIVGQFGKALDPTTNLKIFKKGIDIAAAASQPVKSVYGGKVAYSGELPGYGRMIIVDHGDHFYSICGNLGVASKKVGEEVKIGEEIGTSRENGGSVYFEIRAHNIPVNPTQWLAI